VFRLCLFFQGNSPVTFSFQNKVAMRHSTGEHSVKFPVMQVVVMGVAGSGKSTLAAILAERLACEMAEADAFHSPANVAKMAAGIPLNDKDRAPWLRDIAAWIAERNRTNRSAFITCSALKRAYRDVLRAASPRLVFLHLTGLRGLIADRMRHRLDHYMPVSLLDSQFSTLEPLAPDEIGFVLDISQPPEALASAALDGLSHITIPG
jgi:gluconokinase